RRVVARVRRDSRVPVINGHQVKLGAHLAHSAQAPGGSPTSSTEQVGDREAACHEPWPPLWRRSVGTSFSAREADRFTGPREHVTLLWSFVVCRLCLYAEHRPLHALVVRQIGWPDLRVSKWSDPAHKKRPASGTRWIGFSATRRPPGRADRPYTRYHGLNV